MIKRFEILLLTAAICGSVMAQQDTVETYKKRVLENTEIEILSSYYAQDGDHASVTGGIGTEKLSDFATDIHISIPLNDDDILSVDATISAYTSASSSNLNPFSGASSAGEEDDDNEKDHQGSTTPVTGSPWYASTGASRKDTWKSGNLGYTHSSDDRNSIWGANLSLSTEFDYSSFGFGGSYSKLFNEKNTEIGIKANVFLDQWKPQYPTEIKEFVWSNGNLNSGFFNGVDILDAQGVAIDKGGATLWQPVRNDLVGNTARNTWALSLSFSQIISRNAQFSIFSDLVQQNGWLSNPMQRVYFADRNNYFIGNAASIPNYSDKSNSDVFQLADDIERLPNSRFKLPIGLRFNYFLNENLVLRTYYRYYFDNWGIRSHTAFVELPVKVSDKITLIPSYRYYNQTAADYFAPYEQHLSTSEYYTSDYDLSKFNSNQFGLGVRYTDILTKHNIWKFRLKSLSLNYSYYYRNINFQSSIVTAGAKFILARNTETK